MKKNIKTLLLSNLLVASAVAGSLASTNVAFAASTIVNSGVTQNKSVDRAVNVRSTNSTNSVILGTLQAGDVITVTRVINGWNEFNYKGVTGYVDRRFLTETSATANVATAPVVVPVVTAPVATPVATPVDTTPVATPVATVPVTTTVNPINNNVTVNKSATTSVNVRSSADKNSAIIGALKYGDVVTVNGVTNGWNKVTYNGRTGYVDRRYLIETSAAATIS